MLDIGFMELLLVSIVALLVLGPEKLPQAVRTAALWIGRARRSFNKVRAEIEREINADDIRRQLHNESILADLDEAKEKASRLTRDTKESFSRLEKDVRHGLDGETEDKPADSDGKNHQDASVAGKASGAGETPSGEKPPEPDTREEGPEGPDDSASAADSEPRAARPEDREDTEDTEENKDREEQKPVTDFYNNPPDKVVTVQGRKFKAGKDDDDGA